MYYWTCTAGAERDYGARQKVRLDPVVDLAMVVELSRSISITVLLIGTSHVFQHLQPGVPIRGQPFVSLPSVEQLSVLTPAP